jgi:hypothetical protein
MADDTDAIALTASIQRGLEGKGLIARVAARCFSDDFQSVVSKFIDNKVGLFLDATEAEIEAGENKLEWYAAYQEWVAIFDKVLSELLVAEGASEEEFSEEAERVMESGAEGAEADFLRLLQGGSEYPAFLRMMKDEADEERDE